MEQDHVYMNDAVNIAINASKATDIDSKKKDIIHH